LLPSGVHLGDGTNDAGSCKGSRRRSIADRRSEFQSRGDLLRAFYYTAVIEDQEFSSIRPLIDWLDYNGYAIVLD
jgi:uncharacterized LabA/DUF88 family protein